MDRPLPAELARDIVECGYFPDLVADTVVLALGAERVEAHAVHHEATFAGDEVHRHLTVLVLTASRLLIVHTDETTEVGGSAAASTSESIPLGEISSVALTRIVRNPEIGGTPHRSQLAEAWLTVGWGTMTKIDLEPASCSDPSCAADHGYCGEIVREDLTLRISAAADGSERVAALVSFASALQHATGRRS